MSGFRRPRATWARYQADGGDRLAAAVTYFGFLAFFPLVALAFAALGYVVAGDSAVQRDVERSLSSYLPGLIGDGPHQISVRDVAATKAGAGAFGLVGLLVAGLGWIAALRQSIRVIWHENPKDGGLIRSKLRDLTALLVIGLGVLSSVAVSAAATAVTDQLLRWAGLSTAGAGAVLTPVLAVLVGIAVDTLVLTYLFTLVPRTPGGWRRVWHGALLGAVALEVLKLVGTFLVARTTSNPLYGTFAVVVGLLVWINVISRVLMLAACWTVVGLEELARVELPVAADQLPPAAVTTSAASTADAERLGRDLGFAALGVLGAVALGAARRSVTSLLRLGRR